MEGGDIELVPGDADLVAGEPDHRLVGDGVGVVGVE